MRPLPPKYPLANVVQYGIDVGLILVMILRLHNRWNSPGIPMGRSSMYINSAIGVLLSVLVGQFISDRFYKVACLRRIYGKIPLSVRQSRSISLYGDFQDIYARAVEVMKEFESKNIRCDPECGIITARTRRNRWSWGERLKAVLHGEPDGWISLEIHSGPIVPTVYIDRGINAINVEYFIASMKKQFRTRADRE